MLPWGRPGVPRTGQRTIFTLRGRVRAMNRPLEQKTRPMEPQTTIKLDVAGRQIPFHVRRESVERSPHTGRELNCLHGWVVTAERELYSWLTTTLPRIGNEVIRSHDAGGAEGKWIISWNSYAESSGIHTYTLILREFEELSIESLVIGGVELHPYEYREEFLGNGLVVWAKLLGSTGELERLRALMVDGPVPVERRGIQEAAREMTFGVGEWSKYEERVKYRVVLVDAATAESSRAELLSVEDANARAAFSYYANFVENLASMLLESGVLPPERLASARESARAELGLLRNEFWRVADVDLL